MDKHQCSLNNNISISSNYLWVYDNHLFKSNNQFDIYNT